jgi:hypothetical protein
MEKIWKDYIKLSPEEIKNKYQGNHYEQGDDYKKVSKRMKIIELYYKAIQQNIADGKKESEIQDFIKKIPKKHQDHEIKDIFQAHCLYQIINSYDCICKDLDNFILFIPKELVLKSGSNEQKKYIYRIILY